MASRRSRIVIRPNIKPSLSKSVSQANEESGKKEIKGPAKKLVNETSNKAPTDCLSESLKVDDKSTESTTTTNPRATATVNTAKTKGLSEDDQKEADVGNIKTPVIDLDSDVQPIPSSNSTEDKTSITQSKLDDCQSLDNAIGQSQINEKKEPVKSVRRSRLAIKPNIKPAVKVGAPSSKDKVSSPVTAIPPTDSDAKNGVVVKEDKEDGNLFKNVKSSSLASPVVIPSSPPSSPAPAEEPPSVQPVDETGISLNDDNKSTVALKEQDTSSVAGSYVVSASDAVSVIQEDEETGIEIEDTKDIKKKVRRKIKRHETENQHPREKSPDRQKMKMGDLLFWNPNQNSIPAKAKKNLKKEKHEGVMTTEKAAIDVDHEEEEASKESDSLPAPQIMVGPDGNIIVNMDSTLIKSDKRELTVAVEEDEDDRYLNSNSYRTTKKATVWTETETAMWFIGLSMCGTDFSLLTRLMPHRSRRDLKNKFRREERKNRPLIDKALANRRRYDPGPFEFMKNPKEKPDKKINIKKEKKEKATSKKKVEQLTDQKLVEKIIKKPTKRKKPKKIEESENEEDDWGPDEDYEIPGEETSPVPTPVKRSRREVKPEKSTANENHLLDSSRLSEESPQSSVRTESISSKSQPVAEPPSPPALPRMTEVSESNKNSSSGIQAIPGSTQVQIEMEGVENPVQGVLIPSNMVPTIAPQLGIQNVTPGMQVLLVQEETDSGSLVHVYIIPEGSQPSAAIPGISGMHPTQPETCQPPAMSRAKSGTNDQQQASVNQTSPTDSHSDRHQSPATAGNTNSSATVSPKDDHNSRNNNFPDNQRNISSNDEVSHPPESPAVSSKDSVIRQHLSMTPKSLLSASEHPYKIPDQPVITPSSDLPSPPPLTPATHSSTPSPQYAAARRKTSNPACSPRRPPPPLINSAIGSVGPGTQLPKPAPADSTPPTPSSNLVEMQPVQTYSPFPQSPAPRLDLVKEMNQSTNHHSDY